MRDRRRWTVACLVGVAVLATPGPALAHDTSLGSYRWVDDELAAAGRRADLPAGVPTDLWTLDLQAVLSFPAEALGGVGAEGVVPAEVVPVAVADLGVLPGGLAAASNVYRVDVGLTAPAAIHLAVAHPPTAVLFSAGGTGWSQVTYRSSRPGSVTAPLTRPGYYVVATDSSHLASSGPSWPSAPAAGVAAALLLLGLLRRRTAAVEA